MPNKSVVRLFAKMGGRYSGPELPPGAPPPPCSHKIPVDFADTRALSKSSLTSMSCKDNTDDDDLEDCMLAAFEEWDCDGHGNISLQRFLHALDKLGMKLSEREVATLLQDVGINKEAVLNYKDLVAWLYEAPHLINYFKVQEEIGTKTKHEAEAVEQEIVKAISSGDKAVDVENIDAKIRALQDETRKDLKERLTPVIKKSFAWYDRASAGFLEKSEGITFFANFFELLARHVEIVMDLCLALHIKFADIQDKEALAQVKTNIGNKMRQKRNTFDVKNADDRLKKAFSLVDINKDGKLQEAAIVDALLPGTSMNLEFMKALDLVLEPVDMN